MVDLDEKPIVMYEEMDWAKENMQNAFNGVYRINYQFSLNKSSV